MLKKYAALLFQSKNSRLLFFSILALIIYLFSYNNLMFWDNVLFTSRMGNELYNNGIFHWHIPAAFDPGHPPFLGFLLAIMWHIFGHELWVGHLLMIPFSIGFFYQLHKFISYYVKEKHLTFFAFLLLLVDPTLSAQLVLVNPEVIALFFFFMAINGILYKKKISLKIIGLFFLSIVSFRGMMLAGSIFVFEVFNELLIHKKRIKDVFNRKLIISYIVGASSSVSFLAWHYLSTGWIHTRPDSPYAKIWFVAPLKTILRNIFVVAHRYLDFGRVFVLLFIVISLFIYRKKIFTTEIKQLLLLSFTSVIVVLFTSIFSVNPMGHRYFLVSYLVLILLAFIILNHYYTRKKLIYILLFVGLITGNLWVYPKKIAQGWDASLAHLPYHKLRQEALSYMENNRISVDDCASFFPNETRADYVDLGANTNWFHNFTENKEYIFYSNVYNLTDEQYALIENDYKEVQSFTSYPVTVIIYKKK